MQNDMTDERTQQFAPPRTPRVARPGSATPPPMEPLRQRQRTRPMPPPSDENDEQEQEDEPPPTTSRRQQQSTTTKRNTASGTAAQQKKQSAPQSSPPPPPQSNAIPSSAADLPPAAGFVLGGLGILFFACGNAWQVFTSYVAFLRQFEEGSIYKSMAAADQFRAVIVIQLVCALLAISYQIGLLYLAFQIKRTYDRESEGRAGHGAAIAATALTIASNVNLLIFWGVISLVMDTVGDYYFVGIYTNSPFLLFAYGVALYASSTIMGMYAMQYVWHAMVGHEWWRKLKLDNATRASQQQQSSRRSQ